MTALETYVAAWAANDADAIERSVAPDCRIVESFGPVYLGRARVRQWADAWFADGGVVHDWTIQTLRTVGECEVAEWRFDYEWREGRTAFDGCTLSTTSDGLVADLREYATTADLYTWEGTWV